MADAPVDLAQALLAVLIVGVFRRSPFFAAHDTTLVTWGRSVFTSRVSSSRMRRQPWGVVVLRGPAGIEKFASSSPSRSSSGRVVVSHGECLYSHSPCTNWRMPPIQHLIGDRRRSMSPMTLERLHHPITQPALQALAGHEDDRHQRHRHRNRDRPHAELRRLARGHEHHGGERGGSRDERNRKRDDERLAARLFAQRPSGPREHHADGDHEEDDSTGDRQRRFRQVHHLEELVAAEHERHQQHECDGAFAQNHVAAARGRNAREHGVHDRHVAERIGTSVSRMTPRISR